MNHVQESANVIPADDDTHSAAEDDAAIHGLQPESSTSILERSVGHPHQQLEEGPPEIVEISSPGEESLNAENVCCTPPSNGGAVSTVNDKTPSTAEVNAIESMTRHSFHIKDWAIEILSCVVSICGLIAMVGILRAFDGSPLPSLPLNITLNALLAFLVTFTKAAFMIPIVEATSQWKWNWFTTTRPLTDFEQFDGASRGGWGSLKLIKLLRWKHISTAAAFVSLAGIVTSPLTQQLIKYPQRPSSIDGNATVPVVKHYTANPNVTNFGQRLKVALNPSLSDALGTAMPVAPSCLYNNCVFPRLTTLGVCVATANITSALQVRYANYSAQDWKFGIFTPSLESGFAWNLTLTPDCSFISPNNWWYVGCSQRQNESFGFSHDQNLVDTAIASLPIIYSDFDNISDVENGVVTRIFPRAMEIFFYACVQTLDQSIVDGIPQYTLVNTSTNVNRDLTNGSLSVQCASDIGAGIQHQCDPPDFPYTDWTNGSLLAFHDPLGNMTSESSGNNLDSQYYVQTSTLWMMALQLTTSPQTDILFAARDGVSGEQVDSLFSASIGAALYHNFTALRGGSLATGSWDPATQIANIEKIGINIAIALTNFLRTPFPELDHQNFVLVEGTGITPQVFVQIRWEWLLLILIQIVFCIFYLGITMVYTYRMGVRVTKSSAVAAVLAMDPVSRSSIGHILSTKDGRNKVKEVSVRLVNGELVKES